MSWSMVAAVLAGGFVGAPARALADRAVMSHRAATYAVGTLAVNTSGSLLFGLLTGLHLSHHLGPLTLTLLGTGFCGAYTTFSTFAYETIGLVEDGRYGRAMANVGLSVAAALGAAVAGLAIGLAA